MVAGIMSSMRCPLRARYAVIRGEGASRAFDMSNRMQGVRQLPKDFLLPWFSDAPFQVLAWRNISAFRLGSALQSLKLRETSIWQHIGRLKWQQLHHTLDDSHQC